MQAAIKICCGGAYVAPIRDREVNSWRRPESTTAEYTQRYKQSKWSVKQRSTQHKTNK